ncbi:hypothetical protein HDU93_006868 [Gonapodya sp. JEL0774]|nr:hypothetical protein HDU93_006868 [Gonapodya sp. JEL0774]
MSATPPKAIVVGAGPAGLVAALSLLDAGLPASDVLVLERRPAIASRWNTIQIAGLSLSRFASWTTPDGSASVYSSMVDAGVLGETMQLTSHMEHRLGKPRSERGETEDVANPCTRVVRLFLDMEKTEYDAKKFASKPGQSFDTVRRSMTKCWRAAYIRDIEEHLMIIAVAKGIQVAFHCDTQLVWQSQTSTYNVRVTRKEAKEPQEIALLPLNEQVELKPTLVIVAEGGARNMLKSQGVLARHGIEVKVKSQPKYFAAALIKHPRPTKLIPTGQVVGGTFYFDSPDQHQRSTAVVSGNVIQRSPKYTAMEERGEELPPDTWYLRVPNDDLSMERLANNINGQDFGIVESKTSPAMRQWVESHLTRIMHEFCPAEEVKQAEFTKITAPFTQADTKLDKVVMGRNLVVFGDAARTGHFVSGMGLNTIVAIDSYTVTELWKSLSSGVSTEKALAKYNTTMIRSADAWHKGGRLLHNENWPAWVPDTGLSVKEGYAPPRTDLKFKSIEAMERYVIANFLLRYTVPVPVARRGLRSVAEWVFGGVERSDIPGGKL